MPPRSGAGGLTAAGNAPRPPVVTPGVQPGAQSQVVASRVTIIGAGGLLLIYSPVAAAGNLIGSDAGQPGSDQFKNVYLAGRASYTQVSSSLYRAEALVNGGVSFYSAGSYMGPWTSTGSISIDGSGNMQLVAPGGLFFNGTQITVP
jgi:hypothetical protein